eukprot:2514218-Amphidinium_carterae.1
MQAAGLSCMRKGDTRHCIYNDVKAAVKVSKLRQLSSTRWAKKTMLIRTSSPMCEHTWFNPYC